MTNIVFLGGGRITSALVEGLHRAGHSGRLLVHDRHPAKLRRLQREFKVTAAPDLRLAVNAADLLVIAVRPESIRKLLTEIGVLKKPVIAVSVAAGMPLSRLQAWLGPPAVWARAMPSPVCRTGRGLTAMAFARKMPAAKRKLVADLFARVGDVLELPEKQFDVFTATYSSSHGYHALSALSSAAQKLGLDRTIALTAASHALADGIVSLREEKVPLDRLIHDAATPGGIAATVLKTMDKARYGKIVERGLRAGVARARRTAG